MGLRLRAALGTPALGPVKGSAPGPVGGFGSGLRWGLRPWAPLGTPAPGLVGGLGSGRGGGLWLRARLGALAPGAVGGFGPGAVGGCGLGRLGLRLRRGWTGPGAARNRRRVGWEGAGPGFCALPGRRSGGLRGWVGA
ncbi:hypothetical protein GCM10017778_58270 [Streptomyces vinaceus]|nr:hypothetical protein GCM10017778_58270 [Streptomyces vinaceus]